MFNQKMHESFLSHCDNGLVILENDYSIASVNNAVTELSGFTVEELEGASLGSIFDSIISDNIIKIYKESGCREISKKVTGELIHKSGFSRQAEVLINCTNEGDFQSFWLMIKNKSFRKEMEEKLRHSELMLSTTLESLPFDFWINDADNRTYLQNSHSKALWGDVKGLTPDEVSSDDNLRSEWLEVTGKAFSGQVYRGETSYFIDGKQKYYQNIVAPIKDDEQFLGICGMNIDITKLKESLNRQETLLKEIHHRVKNNLQMIISIIKIESFRISDTLGQKPLLDDIISRIEAVSMIHEKLYMTSYTEDVNVADYIRDLVEHIISGVNLQNLKVNYKLDNAPAEFNTVVTVGLLLNELVTNSIKYAFNGSTEQCLEIRLKTVSDPDTAEVTVSDNGSGLPDDFDAETSDSMGFRLINDFAIQLGGALAWSSSPEGAVFSFTFPIKKAEAK